MRPPILVGTKLSTLMEQALSGNWDIQGVKALVDLVAISSSSLSQVNRWAIQLQKIAESPSGTIRQANYFYLRVCTL